MSAYFFGPHDRRLFGFHHPPVGDQRGAVLICPPWGPEYQFSHRAIRVLARRISECGFHVLRFDYSGTGDSWGDTTEGALDVWDRDVAGATEELFRVSGEESITLVGMRIGAVLAMRAAARVEADRLVLWDPVIDGAAWIREIDALDAGEDRRGGDRCVEFGRHLVSATLLRQIEDIRGDTFPAPLTGRILIVDTQQPNGAAIPASYENVRDRIDHTHTSDAAAWIEDVAIWSGQVPARAIRTIVDWLA